MSHPFAYGIAVLLTALVTLQSILLNDPRRLDTATFETSAEGKLLNQVSTGLRQSLATLVFLRCDEYMHAGDPVHMVVREGDKVIKDEVMGVTWRTNREIVTLLEAVTILDPAYTVAHTLLAEHLTRDRARFREGMAHLHKAILYNQEHPKLHLLYGQAGEIYFQSRLFPQARRYLERTIELYARVRDERLAGTPLFEDEDDQRRLRTYHSYLATCCFEMRDWTECYKWWSLHGEFHADNHISRWMRIWERNPQAVFRPEDYRDHQAPPRQEVNKHKAVDLDFEQGKHQEVWLTPDFPLKFYYKLLFMLTVVLGLMGGLVFWRLW